MHLNNVTLKNYLIISSMTGFLRTTSEQIAGSREADLTWWEGYGTWTLANIFAIVVYVAAKWLWGFRGTRGVVVTRC
ncbi:hypothetical protein T440DRAFT_227077 [Plenodomus tracheiphilus IPT5]|uniref:Uncharacterized protein n=1 Tax=Plenodomus tracheiphilus IPT5 TaxID=1408161 RepID=A0A6A7AVY1_9PLEO|nr:hypothetical protein T440DRAFT_227077 [Plenodomus tracheiphilus IPT5]